MTVRIQMVGVLAATIVMSATNRRVFADPQGRHANLYVTLLRYGVLTLLGAITVLVACALTRRMQCPTERRP